MKKNERKEEFECLLKQHHFKIDRLDDVIFGVRSIVQDCEFVKLTVELHDEKYRTVCESKSGSSAFNHDSFEDLMFHVHLFLSEQEHEYRKFMLKSSLVEQRFSVLHEDPLMMSKLTSFFKIDVVFNAIDVEVNVYRWSDELVHQFSAIYRDYQKLLKEIEIWT